MMKLDDILKFALREGASDIHLKVGMPPVLRINGTLISIRSPEKFSGETLSRIAEQVLSQEQKEVFNKTHQVDLAYNIPDTGRFRVNVFQQRGMPSIAFRAIPMGIPSMEDMHLPLILKKIASEHRGLVLVTGITGSGKSTTLASMINHINTHRNCHIITIEDPIEFIYSDKKSIINQREVGVDTMSFADSLRAALRQDPDVILVGEMRDLETVDIALTAAETGHLVFSTLHTLDARETINRIVSIFPPHQQEQVRMQLSTVLKSVISQRLMPTKDGKGRVPAVEILITTARIRELISDKTRTKEIVDTIAAGRLTYNMQTFDQSIMGLYKDKYISYEEALKQASNPSDFSLKVKGITSTSDMGWKDFSVAEKKNNNQERARDKDETES